jgi:hypothetical protein
VLHYLPRKGGKEIFKKEPFSTQVAPLVVFVVLCLFGFTSVFFILKLFLHILTVFALSVLIPHCFEGANVVHGMSC